MRRIAYALALALAPLTAQAGELEPAQAHKIELNGLNGVAYYTVEDGQYHVVAVLASGEAGAPVRFSAMFEPGQGFTIAVPGPVGERESVIEIVRQGDIVAVSPVVVALN